MIRTVADLPQDYYYEWITVPKKIEEISEHFGRKDWFVDYDSLLAWVEDGDYKEVYGCDTAIPWLDSDAKMLVKNFKAVYHQLADDNK